MSLIADALKTAQREGRKGAGPTPAEVRATEGFFAYRERPAPRKSSYVMYALGGGVALLLAAAVSYFAQGIKPERLSVPRSELPPVPPVSEGNAVARTIPIPADDTLGARSAMMQFDAKAGEPPAGEFSLERPLTAMTPPPAFDESFRHPPMASSVLPAPVLDSVAVALVSGPASAGTGVAALTPDSTPAAPRARVRRPGTLRITVEGGSPSRVVSTVAQQALDAQRRGDATRARDLYTRAIAQGGGSAELYNNLGVLDRGAGDLAAAAERFRNAIAVDRSYAPAWSNLGIVMDALGKRPEAIAAFQQAQKIDPTNMATKLNLALQYRAISAASEARRLVDEVVRGAPEFAEGHYALGQLYEDAGDRGNAIVQYNLFLKTAGTRLPTASSLVRQHIAQLSAAAR